MYILSRSIFIPVFVKGHLSTQQIKSSLSEEEFKSQHNANTEFHQRRTNLRCACSLRSAHRDAELIMQLQNIIKWPSRDATVVSILQNTEFTSLQLVCSALFHSKLHFYFVTNYKSCFCRIHLDQNLTLI